MLETPEGAVWFGFEYVAGVGDDGAAEWARLDEPALGGKWFRVGTADLVGMARRALEIVGDTGIRVVWAPKDRRYSLGTSPNFEPSAFAQQQDPPPPPPPQRQTPPPKPAESATHAAPPRARAKPAEPEAAKLEPVPIPPELIPGTPQHVPPMVPMPCSPPQPGVELGPTSMFVYIHSLVAQDKLIHQQQTLSMFQMMIETERARSRETLRAMELHFQSAAQARDELQRTILESQKEQNAPALAQLTDGLQGISRQLAELAEGDEEDDRDQPQQQQQPQPSDMQMLVAGLGAVLNSPIGAQIVKAIEGRGAVEAVSAIASAAAE